MTTVPIDRRPRYAASVPDSGARDAAGERRSPASALGHSPPPGTPSQVIWAVWLLREVGVPVGLLLWFVVRADSALQELVAAQRATLDALARLLEVIR